MGSDRDYYADLELSQTADITEIKKQFRKLALKYHPDRNPGREAEVNAQFQIIQSAHEVLGDPQSKAKYDASLPRSKYPGASGVRGNPWSHVGEQFPAPPRRNQGGTRRPAPPPPPPPTGAQRWQSRFASGTAPTAKQSSANDPQLKKNAAKAFEHMRKNPGASGASPTRPRPASSQPPPMPPRTESARQRREASFGNRRTGYQPGDRSGEDEPPVSRHSYQSPAKPPRPPKEPMDATEENAAPMPDPLAQFRDPVSPLDPRPSMPYSRMGGEKTNPSDGTSPARAKSARETGHRPDHSTEDGTASRQNAHRSSSLPRTAGTDRLGDDLDAESGRPRSSEPASGYAESSFKSRSNAAHNADAKSADESSSRHHNSSQTDGAHKRPSMYATPSKRHKAPMACGNFSMYQTPDPVTSQPHQRRNTTGACFKESTKPAASSGLHSSPSLSSYELKQYQVLDELISNAEVLLRGDSQNHNTKNIPTPEESLDLTRVHSFTIPVDGETFRRTSPEPKPFTRRSTEEIDTSFVDEDESQSWQFSAGGERPRAQPKRRVQPDGPGSPAKTASPPPSDVNQQAPQSAQPDATFNPGGWNDQFGPQTFVPSRDQAASASPTRTNRKNSRKARSGVKGVATAGTAVIIDSSSEDEAGTQWQGRKAPVEGGLDSPQAMDLDSPPAKPMDAPPVSHSARNIPVEPTRPEWRQGNVGDTNGEAKPVPPNAEPGLGAMGSEDTEEFRASFSDIRNVAPFAQPASGLKSFDDLKDNLPFESKAATDTPVTLPPVRPLNFPSPPNAPRPPPTAAISGIKPNVTSWSRYLEDFEKYLRAWDDWNATVSDHFRERKRLIRDARANAGYSFLGIRGDTDVVEYYSWVQQDNDVRRRWCTACEEHEQRMREFIAFREKMK